MVNSIQSNDELIRVYEKFADLVYRIAFLQLGNIEEAKDTMQNVFLKFIKANKKFESEEHLKAWLIVTTHNSAKDILKSFWYKRTTSIEFVNDVVYTEEQNKNDYVRNAVMTLKEKYRIPLYLYYFEGYSSDEISKILQINHSTIRSRLRAARNILKIIIEEENNDE